MDMPVAAGSAKGASSAGATASAGAGCVWRINDISPIWRRAPFAGIDQKSLLVDLAEAHELLDRAQCGRPVIAFARQFDEPIHAELLQHRRLDPRHLIGREDVLRGDLRRGCPARELLEGERPENVAILIFSEEPRLRDRRVHYPLGEGVGVVAGGGIMIVWPIWSFRSFSIWLNFCSSSTLTLCIFAMEVSVSPFATT